MYKLKVLIADDHDSFRRILQSFLSSQNGVEIVGEAADGLQAVEKAEQLHPDLIFMDVHMPGQNGLDAAKIIKSRLPSIRIFILSMDVSEVCREKVCECADGFIAKSSIKKTLLSILPAEWQLHKKNIIAKATAA